MPRFRVRSWCGEWLGGLAIVAVVVLVVGAPSASAAVEPVKVATMPATVTCPVVEHAGALDTKTLAVLTTARGFRLLPVRVEDVTVAAGRVMVMPSVLLYPKSFAVLDPMWVQAGVPTAVPQGVQLNGTDGMAAVHCIDVYTRAHDVVVSSGVDQAAVMSVLQPVIGKQEVLDPGYQVGCLAILASDSRSKAPRFDCKVYQPDVLVRSSVERMLGSDWVSQLKSPTAGATAIGNTTAQRLPWGTYVSHTATVETEMPKTCAGVEGMGTWLYNKFNNIATVTRGVKGELPSTICARAVGATVIRRPKPAAAKLHLPRVACVARTRKCRVTARVEKIDALKAVEGQVQRKAGRRWVKAGTVYLPTLGRVVTTSTRALAPGSYRVRLYAPGNELAGKAVGPWIAFQVR